MGTSLRTSVPASGYGVRIAAAVLVLTLVALVLDGRRTRTGELLIQSDRREIRITIRHGHRRVIGPTQKRSFTLWPGDYEIDVDDENRDRVTISRGGHAVVRITDRVPSPNNGTTSGSP